MLTRPDQETKEAQILPSEARSESLVAFFTMACIMVAAVNLRPALTSIATLMTEIQQSLGLSRVGIGALTTMPVLCFGIFGPLAPLLAVKIGLERALALLFMGLTTGLALRALPQGPALFAGTLLAGAAIGMAGVLLPVVIRRRFPEWLGPMTGLYTMILSVGGASAAGLTPVFKEALHSWTLALASWSIPALIAGLLWSLLASAGAATTGTARLPRFELLLRDRMAWYVTAFMGLQAGLAFIVLGWLPTLLRDRGLDMLDAGVVTTVSIMSQTATALLVPSLATRRVSPQLLIILVLSATCVGFLGLIYAPLSTRLIWALILGLGQGGLFGLALLFVTLRAPTAEVTAMLSGMSQSIGYFGASLFPFAVSLLRSGQDPFLGPSILVVMTTVACAWCGVQAAAPRYVLPHFKDGLTA